MLTSVGANVLTGGGLTTLTRRFAQDVVTTNDAGLFAEVNTGLASDLFLGATRLTTIAGTQHPQWGVTGHPADRLAQTFAGKVMNAVDLAATDRRWDAEDVIPAGVQGDLVSFGSPVSNEFTAIILDYLGNDPYHLARSAEPLIPTAWAYRMAGTSVSAELDQWQGSAGLYPVANWGIGDLRSGASQAALIRDGSGQDDLLLVTRIRNFLDAKAFSAGRRITLVGGAHGLGTVAFGRLLAQDNLLSHVVKSASYGDFQALFRVSGPRRIPGIDPRRDRLYDQFPDSIELADDVVTLSVPDASYDSARIRAIPRLREYFEHNSRGQMSGEGQ